MFNKALYTIVLLMTSGIAVADTSMSFQYASVIGLQVVMTLCVIKLASVVRKEYALSLIKE